MKTFFLLLAACCSFPVFPQNIHNYPAASFAGAGSSSDQSANAFVLSGNPALTALIKNLQFAASSEIPFLLPQLKSVNTYCIVPIGTMRAGIQLGQSGQANYRSTELAFTGARILGKQALAGVRIGWRQDKFSGGYPGLGYWNAAAGASWRITPVLLAGSWARWNSAGFYKDKLLPSLVSLGLAWQPSTACLLQTSWYQERGQSPGIDLSIRYRPTARLETGIGLATAPGTWWWGAGITVRHMRFFAYTGLHPQLGFSPGIALLYEREGGSR